jgi:aminopeptidase N
MTAVEGEDIIGGGMEYPMMTLIGSYTAAGDTALYAVTAHELAHMWIPMIISNNERRYAWFDEGSTTFNENQIKEDFYRGIDWDLPDQDIYMQVAEAELEGEIMRLSDLHAVGPAYTIASYMKPSTALVALRGVIGEEAFNAGWHALFDRWAFKHAYPWDMWNTFEDVSGRDLDWFWRSWYYETWTLDHAITEVTAVGGETTITIEDQGWNPMPVDLVITMADGSTTRQTVPVEVWLEGATSTTVTVEGDVARVEIDPEHDFADVDRDDNVWER